MSDEKKFVLFDGDDLKAVRSVDYNYVFNKKTGYFARWGKTKEDDPQFSPIGPEILDLEVSVDGCSMGCSFCYKGNKPSDPKNMSFETFVKVFHKMPKCLTQIAFGITDIQTNPDFLKMLKYSHENGVIPNFTLTGIDLTDEIADEVVKYVGAVAVSAYAHAKDVCYDTVKAFTDRGLDQVNIHLMVSQETIDFAYEVLNDIQNDERLSKLNACVFLGVKNKGRAKDGFNPLTSKQYSNLVKYCMDNNIRFGFDSCSAPKFEKTVHESDGLSDQQKASLIACSESCESGLFSSYINVDAAFFPCSFTEGEDGWTDGISVVDADDFLKDVWYHPRVKKWRSNLLGTICDNCRRCPVFPEINP